MKELATKLNLAERDVYAKPSAPLSSTQNSAAPPKENADAISAQAGNEADQVLQDHPINHLLYYYELVSSDLLIAPQSIRLDNEDEAFPVDSEVVSHIGPIECKMLEGSDRKLYILEIARLTPLDANYVEVIFYVCFYFIWFLFLLTYFSV